MGMPRRVYTYMAGLGFEPANILATVGAAILATGVLFFIINFFVSLRSGKPAGNNPWEAGSLEWATTSPPPPYNFPVIPTVTSSEPLWEQTDDPNLWRVVDLHQGGGTVEYVDRPQPDELADTLDAITTRDIYADLFTHDTVSTTLLDARPEGIMHVPEDSYWPLFAAVGLAVFFAGFLVNLFIVAGLGLILAFAGIWGWLWPVEFQPEEA